MEPLHTRDTTTTEQNPSCELTGASEQWLTEDIAMALLNIPQDGIFGVNAALLFARDQHMCAYWWREQNRQQHVRLVSPQTVRAALNKIAIDSGYLPPHVVRLGITQEGANWMVVYVPPQAYQLTIERDNQSQHTIEIGLPGCVFMGLADGYWIWAVKDASPAAETPLYHFPLPNIGVDGTMCFGDTIPPGVTWPQIMPAFFLFLASPFNSHWAQEKSRQHTGDIRERLIALAGQQPPVFPEEELVPLRYRDEPEKPVTVDALLQAILRRPS